MRAVLALVICTAAAESAPTTGCPCHREYEAFRSEFNRPRADYEVRCNTFCRNDQLVKDHNAHPESTYTIALRWFHDLPDGNAKAYSRGLNPKHRKKAAEEEHTAPYGKWVDTADSKDWWAEGHVTDVRNQGSCGDCWAESATAVVEAAYAQQTGTVTRLSVQQLAECTPGQEYNRGCGGGWPLDALNYVKARGGMCTEQDYPTAIGDGNDRPCNETLAYDCQRPIRITDVVQIGQGDEEQLFVALNRGVVSVAIDASGQGFGSYASGIYNGMINGTADCNAQFLDHAVLATGYGLSENNVPYYTVKNSWGDTQWGNMGGYIQFQRGLNTCGIAEKAVYVIF